MATRNPVYPSPANPSVLTQMDAGLGDTLPSTLLEADVVRTTGAQAITGVKTLTTPIIGDMSGAQHTHLNAAGGGLLNPAAMSPRPFYPLAVAVADSAALANSAAETALGSTALAANLLQVGRVLRVRASGRASSLAGSSLTLKVKVNGIVVRNLGAVVMGAVANAPFALDVLLTCRTAGAAGVVQGAGGGSLNLVAVQPIATLPAVDTTILGTVEVTGTWSLADPGNTCVLETFLVELAG